MSARRADAVPADVQFDVVAVGRLDFQYAVLPAVEEIGLRGLRHDAATGERDAGSRIVVVLETPAHVQRRARAQYEFVLQRLQIAAVGKTIRPHVNSTGCRHGGIVDFHPPLHAVARTCVTADLDVPHADVHAVGDDDRAVASVEAHAQFTCRLERAAAGDCRHGHCTVLALHGVDAALLVRRRTRERDCAVRGVRVVAGEVERARSGDRQRKVVEPRAVERERVAKAHETKGMGEVDSRRVRDRAMHFSVPVAGGAAELVGEVRGRQGEKVEAVGIVGLHVEHLAVRCVGGILVGDLLKVGGACGIELRPALHENGLSLRKRTPQPKRTALHDDRAGEGIHFLMGEADVKKSAPALDEPALAGELERISLMQRRIQDDVEALRIEDQALPALNVPDG